MLLRILVMDTDRQHGGSSASTWNEHGTTVVGEAGAPAEALGVAKKGVDVAIIEVPEGPGEESALDFIASAGPAHTGSIGHGDRARWLRRPSYPGCPRRGGGVPPTPISKDDLTAAIEKVRRLRKGPAPADPTVRTCRVRLRIEGWPWVHDAGDEPGRQPGPERARRRDCRGPGPPSRGRQHAAQLALPIFSPGRVCPERAVGRELSSRSPGAACIRPAGPAAPSQVERSRFTPEQVREGLGVIRSHFAHVVIDLPHDLDPGTIAALEESNDVLYLVGLNVPAVRAAAAGLTRVATTGTRQPQAEGRLSRARFRRRSEPQASPGGPGRARVLANPQRLSDGPLVHQPGNAPGPVLAANGDRRNLKELSDKLNHGVQGERKEDRSRLLAAARTALRDVKRVAILRAGAGTR